MVSPENLKAASAEKTIAVINTDMVPTIDNIRARVPLSGPGRMLDIVNATTIRGRNLFVDANRLAEGLFGSHLAANIFLTGVAYQGGLIPVSAEAMEQAIGLNGVEAGKNRPRLPMGTQVLFGCRLGRATAQTGRRNRDQAGPGRRTGRLPERRLRSRVFQFSRRDRKPRAPRSCWQVLVQADGV